MRSLELVCIMISLVVLTEVAHYLIHPRPNLYAIAKQLAYEIEHTSGVKVIDIGLEALVIIENNKLKVLYQGSMAEARLRRQCLNSIDYGPLITIYANTTHAWLGQSYEVKHVAEVRRGYAKAPIILYTMIPIVKYRLYEEIVEEAKLKVPRYRWWGCPDTFDRWQSKHYYRKPNFDIYIKATVWKGSYISSSRLYIEHGGRRLRFGIVHSYGYTWFYWAGCLSKAFKLKRRKTTIEFIIRCRGGKAWLEVVSGLPIHGMIDGYKMLGDKPSRIMVRLWCSLYHPIHLEAKVRVWSASWSDSKQLDLRLKPSGLISSLGLKDASKVGFNVKPMKLIVGDQVITKFTFDSGWWTATIPSSEGSGKAYFKTELKKVEPYAVGYHYEYEISVKRGILALVILSNYDVEVWFNHRRLMPREVYAYNATYLVYEYEIPREGVAKVILKP